ncbi:hypothetical protein C0216_02575 [Streptomyces globosus]|uniref:Uncharacterized protein n=1 Tax=Streptomyces globosus TaxID=68209 RepID=A0A344TV00_9ACTN|nr:MULTISPECIES: hypothetical protein [Streptomyces]AXE22471.1 hypothetical protein C0216_02575 [Streptomyces globosus]
MGPDVCLRISQEARDRLAAAAAEEGLSLRAYLVRLAGTLPAPQERAGQAGQARAALKEWSGHAPTPAEVQDLDSELDRRLARAIAR